MNRPDVERLLTEAEGRETDMWRLAQLVCLYTLALEQTIGGFVIEKAELEQQVERLEKVAEAAKADCDRCMAKSLLRGAPMGEAPNGHADCCAIGTALAALKEQA
jgi:hypothetical protein